MNIGRISSPSIWSTGEIIMNHLRSCSAGSDKYGFVWWMSFRTSFTCFQHEDELDLGKRKRRRGQGWVALIISATWDVWRACDLSSDCFGSLKVSFCIKTRDNKLYWLHCTKRIIFLDFLNIIYAHFWKTKSVFLFYLPKHKLPCGSNTICIQISDQTNILSH